MGTLRSKLFPEPRLVDLPFDLVLVGAPEMESLLFLDRNPQAPLDLASGFAVELNAATTVGQ